MNSRLLAAHILMRVIQDGQSLTAALDNASRASEPSQTQTIAAADKAFIQALCYGVCRQYHYLEFILNKLVNKPLKDAQIKALILIGLYQLKFMRVKPHAAVSETVQAVGRKVWAKTLINAVLRNFIRQQSELEKQAELHQSAKFSHPDWLIAKLRQDWPEYADSILLENNQQPPMALRVNLARLGRAEYLEQLAGAGITGMAVACCPSAVILDKPVSVEALPGFNAGWISVQDTAAQLAAGLLDLQPGQRVLDVCAAPGGKTAHILEAQPGLKEVTAVDIEPERLARVGENLQRLNLKATLLEGDATAPDSWWDGQLFDRILLDAPCSALGVIRRHPDIKLLRRPADIAALQELQQRILRAVWPLLAPGGLLLYATCSILKQENEGQIATFLDACPEAVAEPIHAEWGIAVGHGRQILTGRLNMDGFYYARLRKR